MDSRRRINQHKGKRKWLKQAHKNTLPSTSHAKGNIQKTSNPETRLPKTTANATGVKAESNEPHGARRNCLHRKRPTGSAFRHLSSRMQLRQHGWPMEAAGARMPRRVSRQLRRQRRVLCQRLLGFWPSKPQLLFFLLIPNPRVLKIFHPQLRVVGLNHLLLG